MKRVKITFVEGLRIFFGDKPYEKGYQFSVEIYKPVIDRIFKSLVSSDIEEGGKFLGKIHENDNQISVNIYTYIDAGPKVSNSRTHIMPDGGYQEHLFRVIESYDSEIEHVGSWHSHHSNGYESLSPGDITTYLSDVNNPDYNLDWFFVMLITRLKEQSMEAKYYLFHRGDEHAYVITQEQIKSTNTNYKYEDLLQEAEKSTYSYRNQQPKIKLGPIQEKHAKDEEYLMDEIRLDDKTWIRKTYPSAQTYRNKKNGNINWRWIIPTKTGAVEIKYIYPERTNNNEALGNAVLIIKRGETEISHLNIELNEFRFRKIIEEIENAMY